MGNPFDGEVAGAKAAASVLAPQGRPRYRKGAMANRLQVNFHKPVPTVVAEDGMARPCARGVGWDNEHTEQTLAKRTIPRTDAKGQPVDEPATTTDPSTSTASSTSTTR